MAVTPTYPGVYVQELPTSSRTIASVPTSIAAFVGRAMRGPVNTPTPCFNMGEFNRRFGGLAENSTISYAVDDFFQNGGGQCEIVRVFREDADNGIANLTLGNLQLRATSPGSWGGALRGRVDHPELADPASATVAAEKYGLEVADLFDLIIEDTGTGAREVFRNLTMREDGGQRRFDRILGAASTLVEFLPDGGGAPTFDAARPAATPANTFVDATDGNDGQALDDAALIGDEDLKTGMQALRKADIFNLLCIPPDTRDGTLTRPVREAAASLCADELALFIVDPPAAWDANPDTAANVARTAQLNPAEQVLSLANADYAALYFPRIRKRDMLRAGQIDTFPPCGTIAGVMARTDTDRGVWKAPAGLGASIAGSEALTVKLTDNENGLLNPIAVNCLRSFPNFGQLVWGSRTLLGSDAVSDQYKYIPVRRLALFIEKSLLRGTQWVVFEGNDEPLWAQMRLSIGSFMQRLFLQGAFQGTSPKEAYFVKCDSSTTTQDDINRGIVNAVIGFAPLQPAEFVVLSIQQIRNES